MTAVCVKLTGTDVEVAVPRARFNAVSQLGHIMIHLFDQGIGFRQLIDYFFVLKGQKYKKRLSSLSRLIRLAPLFPGEAVFEIMGKCVAVIKRDVKKVVTMAR